MEKRKQNSNNKDNVNNKIPTSNGNILAVPIIKLPYHRKHEPIESNEDYDFKSIKERYEKRIKLVERRIENLKMENKSIKFYKEVRKMNSIEKIFNDSVFKVKNEIFRRKFFTNTGCSLKISQSQPDLAFTKKLNDNKDSNEQPESVISLKDFTDTDKL